MANNPAKAPTEEMQHAELVEAMRQASISGDAAALRATMADAAGVFIYFGVATAILFPS